jgi:nucleoside-triphosphatase
MIHLPTDLFRPEVHGRLSILTGPAGSGKSTFCARLAAEAQKRHLTVRGLYSPAVLHNGHKIGIDLCLLPEQQCRRLGTKRPQQDTRSLTQHWQMNEETLRWGNAHLHNLPESQLLIIDELGPLEFLGQQGLTAALSLLDARAHRQAVVVIRPALLPRAQARWPWARVLTPPAATP